MGSSTDVKLFLDEVSHLPFQQGPGCSKLPSGTYQLAGKRRGWKATQQGSQNRPSAHMKPRQDSAAAHHVGVQPLEDHAGREAAAGELLRVHAAGEVAVDGADLLGWRAVGSAALPQAHR